MANDLVQWGHSPTDDNREDEWDRPPTDAQPRPLHTAATEGAARSADKDAAHARQVGDANLAWTRTEDAADLRQRRWDWGDAQTWVWIIGMCVGFLLFSLLVYLMPQGRHNQNDLPAPTPTIRVY